MTEGLDKDHLEKEFEPFLKTSARGDIKKYATEFFLGLTGSDDGIKFVGSSTKFIEGITSLMEDSNEDIRKNVFKTLINLATHAETSVRILNVPTCITCLKDLMSKILDPEYKQADTACKLLSNLTRTEKCAAIVFEKVFSQDETVSIIKIVTVICNLQYNKHANLHYLAAVLGNLSQLRAVRDKLLIKDQWVVQKLFPFTEYKDSTIRRHGIVSCLKNCCWDSEYHDWLLSDEVDILPRFLLPLAGPEELDDDDMEKLPDDLQYLPPDKERERDPEIRRMLVEAIFRLCATKSGRLYLRDKNAYVIMREYHRWEKVPANDDPIMNVIDVLIKDEEPGDVNLQEYQIPEHIQEQFDKEEN